MVEKRKYSVNIPYYKSLPLGETIRDNKNKRYQYAKRRVTSVQNFADLFFILRKSNKLMMSEMAKILHIPLNDYRHLESGILRPTLAIYLRVVEKFDIPEKWEIWLFSSAVYKVNSNAKYKRERTVYVFPELSKRVQKMELFLLFYRKLLTMDDACILKLKEKLESL